MAIEDITYEDLNANEKRIYLSVKSKGFNVSPRNIRANPFEEAWIAQGALEAIPTTTTAAPTTTTAAPTTTTAAPTTTTAAPTTTTAAP